MATYCLEDGGDIEPYSCPICFEDYDLLDVRRAPKLLLCLHTFCLECTQKLWKVDGTLECSMCRMRHEQVSLEDLFDNHVIIQHLRLEREKADLEYAREIEKELRSNESDSLLEPLDNPVLEEQNDVTDDVIEILDATDIDEEEEEEEEEEEAEANEIMVEDDNTSVINVDDSQEEIQRNDCQLYLGFLESFGVSSQSDSDNDDAEENDDREENGDDETGIDQPDGEGQDDSSDEGNEDNENQVFCFSHFSEILEQAKEEDIHGDSDNGDEGDTNEEVYENPSLMVENFTCSFGMDNGDDGEDVGDEEEDEEDRFHSACDDISTSHWVSDDLQVQEGSEDDADNSLSCWQILRPETLLDK